MTYRTGSINNTSHPHDPVADVPPKDNSADSTLKICIADVVGGLTLNSEHFLLYVDYATMLINSD
jgi:hypothetical protein